MQEGNDGIVIFRYIEVKLRVYEKKQNLSIPCEEETEIESWGKCAKFEINNIYDSDNDKKKYVRQMISRIISLCFQCFFDKKEEILEAVEKGKVKGQR